MRPLISSGSCGSVSGVMPCVWVAVVFRTDVPLVTSTRSWRPPTGRVMSTRTWVLSGTTTSFSETC